MEVLFITDRDDLFEASKAIGDNKEKRLQLAEKLVKSDKFDLEDLLNIAPVDIINSSKSLRKFVNRGIYERIVWTVNNRFSFNLDLHPHNCPSFFASYKNQIISTLLTAYKPEFMPEARPKVLEFIYLSLKNKLNSDEVYSLIRKYGKDMNLKTLDGLVNTDNAYHRDDVKRVYDKLPIVEMMSIRKKGNKEVVKALAKRPALFKCLNFPINIDYDTLSVLPPARRFDFVRDIYFFLTKKPSPFWLGEHFLSSPAEGVMQYIYFKPISHEDMKNLLFAISLRKHSEFEKWFNDVYEKSVNKNGGFKHSARQNLKKLKKQKCDYLDRIYSSYY